MQRTALWLCGVGLAVALAFTPVLAATKKTRHAAQPQSTSAPAKNADDAQDDAKAAANLPAPSVAPMPSAGPSNGPAPPPPQIAAKSWVLMDYASGQILAGDNADARVDPASITKVMTSYVVAAQLAAGKISLDDDVFVSENAWRGGGASTDGSTSFLAVNSKVKLKDLLYGMIIQSGNDAAIALAEHVSGSEAAFAQLMNQYAQQLGMTGTHYVNPSGLPAPEEYTTAHDIAVLSRALIHNFPQEYKIYSIKQFEWNGITQHNRNTLLWRDASVDGIKTGHTRDAGFCLAASALRGDQRLISVVMGAGSDRERTEANASVLAYGFRFFETHKLFDARKALATPVLWRGANDKAGVGLAEDLLVTLPRGRYGDLKATMDLPGRLIAPYHKDQQIGTLRIRLDGKVLVERPLIVLDEQPEGGFWHWLFDTIAMWFQSAPASNVEVGPTVPVKP